MKVLAVLGLTLEVKKAARVGSNNAKWACYGVTLRSILDGKKSIIDGTIDDHENITKAAEIMTKVSAIREEAKAATAG